MIDIDLFNKEQWAYNYDFDCLEFWAYLVESWKVDYSDQEYQARKDEQLEKEFDLDFVEQRWN